MKTIFRTHKKTGEVFALFPYEIADSNLNITYFSLSEGHSAADYHKMLKESRAIHVDLEGYSSEELERRRIKRHFEIEPDPIKLEVIKNRSQTKFLKAVSEFRAKNN
jgi:hypothetical protein